MFSQEYKVLILTFGFLLVYVNIVTVDGSESNINLPTISSSLIARSTKFIQNSKSTQKYKAAILATIKSERNSTEKSEQLSAGSNVAKSREKELPSNIKETELLSIPRIPNKAILSEARITSITFRSEDGDIDASGDNKDNSELETASATENPYLLPAYVSNEQILLSSPVSFNETKKDKLEKTFVNEKNQINISTKNNDKDAKSFNSSNQLGTTLISSVKLSALPKLIVTASPTSLTTKNNSEHERFSISSNGMHVERGSYRIKIAEIITNEFNNGHNKDEFKVKESVQNGKQLFFASESNPINQHNKDTHNNIQINIADLYPSKLEDFTSIIRESNEKLIKEKNRFVGIGKNNDKIIGHINNDNRYNIIDDDNEQENSIHISDSNKYGLDRESQETQINGIPNATEKNIPTTKIEIELIDEPATSNDVKIVGVNDEGVTDYVNPIEKISDKITDFTSKMQVNDELISNIEQSFRESSVTNIMEHPMPKLITVNRPAKHPLGFIERRAKKFDPYFRKRVMENRENEQHVQTNIDWFSKNNSKELYSDLHLNDTTTFKEPISISQDQRTNYNLTTVTANNLKSLKKYVQPHFDKSDRSTAQNIVFINVNNKNKASPKDVERLQEQRNKIIKESQSSVVGLNMDMIQPSKYMHLNIVHDDVLRHNTFEPAKFNYTDGNKGLTTMLKTNLITTTSKAKPLSTVPIVRVTEETITVKPIRTGDLSVESSINSVKSILIPIVENISQISTILPIVTETTEKPFQNKLTHQAHLVTDYYLKQKLLGNRLYDGSLLEADCDMLTQIPSDSTIWRGNETHELNLPTTVSFQYVYLYICKYTV